MMMRFFLHRLKQSEVSGSVLEPCLHPKRKTQSQRPVATPENNSANVGRLEQANHGWLCFRHHFRAAASGHITTLHRH